MKFTIFNFNNFERNSQCNGTKRISFRNLTPAAVILVITVGLNVHSAESAQHRNGDHLILGNHNDIKYSEADIKVTGGDNTVINSTRVIIKKENNNKNKHTSKNGAPPPDGKVESASDNSVGQNNPIVEVRHMDTMTLTVKVDGETYILELHLNKYFLADNYTENLIGHDSQEAIEVDVVASNCYYTGVVSGYNGSVAAVSTCNGIVGMFRVGGETFEISAVKNEGSGEIRACLSCKHVVARSSQNVFRSGYKCGLNDNFKIFETRRKKREAINVWPQDQDGLTRIVEIYCINDFNQYKNFSQDQAAVFQRMKDLVNMASALYHELNLYLVLVGAECWTSDKVTADLTNPNKFLEDITIYGDSNIAQSRDVVLLITSLGEFQGGTIGLANTATACELAYAYCFICDLDHTPGYTIDTVAHEVGHTLGLNHTSAPNSGGPCPCDDPSNNCIMDPYTSSSPPTAWDSCSKNYLKSAAHYDKYYCLYNTPSTVLDPNSLCGNGLVEAGEQCDCGRANVSECNPKCCSNTTCQLINNAQCAYGRCCNVAQCTIKPRYTECRAAAGDCDLSEYCSGSDPICPTDVYKSYNTPCQLNSVSAYCYQGKCNTREAQCAAMAPDLSSGVADIQCYNNFNMRGDYWGNCGPPNENIAKDSWIACPTVGDTPCGLLQCATTFTGQLPSPSYYNITFVTSSTGTVRCLSSLDPEKRRYSFVPDGTICAQGKVCQKQRCIDLTSAANCTNNQCSGHGVCNNWGQCHCDVTFGGAYCNETGEGGSSHSNPIAYNGPPILSTISTSTASGTTTTLTTTTTTTTIPTTILAEPGSPTATPEIPTSPPSTEQNSGQSTTSGNRRREMLIVIAVPVGIVTVGLVLCFCTFCGLTQADEAAAAQAALQQRFMPPPAPPAPPPYPPPAPYPTYPQPGPNMV